MNKIKKLRLSPKRFTCYIIWEVGFDNWAGGLGFDNFQLARVAEEEQLEWQ